MSEGGALAVGAGYSGSQITFTVVMSCLTAASGGLILGYDIGITGQFYHLPNMHAFILCSCNSDTLLSWKNKSYHSRAFVLLFFCLSF